MKIDLEGKKYLITSGCSFTDGFFMKEKGIKPKQAVKDGCVQEVEPATR